MADSRPANPPPLTVAVSLVAVQGLVLIALGVAEAFSVVGDRLSVGISTAIFFLVYGVALVACAVALTRRWGWARGPVLMSQLIQLGIAWNVRDAPLLALVLAVAALVALAGMLSPASIEVLMPTAEDDAG
ncbi:MAG: hypothetical protein OSB43_07530 [Nocardioides sp.]|uniref:hypothetical protein n=1 Tax=Nocardioides sp. TaxID=35761 RepID=UPI0023A128DE|nr:hypothetical protein [Nocardioides sp.]MDE0776106.1 hypothetical protein [Nocardioides sp.]